MKVNDKIIEYLEKEHGGRFSVNNGCDFNGFIKEHFKLLKHIRPWVSKWANAPTQTSGKLGQGETVKNINMFFSWYSGAYDPSLENIMDSPSDFLDIREKYGNFSYLEWIYTVTQYYTFNLENNNIDLYRVLFNVHSSTQMKMIRQKKIKTNKLSSFSEDYTAMRMYAGSIHENDYIKIKSVFEFYVSVPNNEVIMTHKDWLSLDLIAYEKEYILYNENDKVYEIEII